MFWVLEGRSGPGSFKDYGTDAKIIAGFQILSLSL